MDLSDTRLDEWLLDRSREEFPGSHDYGARLRIIAEKAREVSASAEKGALWDSVRRGETPVYLTNHGPEHIDYVVQKATRLLAVSECSLTPYEAYLLLAAINIHDAGLVHGRAEHEASCVKIMEELGGSVVDNEREKRTICRIAAAHSGRINGNKDTISRLQEKHVFLDQTARKQLLAAILRLADELADDRTRASRYELENEGIPKASEVHHAYSDSLYAVEIGPRDVVLSYEMSRERAVRKWGKAASEVYLVDEIYERTLKMHLERLYCLRFLRQHGFNLDRIKATIQVFDEFSSGTLSRGPLHEIPYTLEASGYPKCSGGIAELCPSLKGQDGEALSRDLSRAKGV